METEHIFEILCKFKYSENPEVIWTVEYKMNWSPKYVQIVACDSVCIPLLVTAAHRRLLASFTTTCAAHSAVREGSAQGLLRRKQGDSFSSSFLATMCFF